MKNTPNFDKDENTVIGESYIEQELACFSAEIDAYEGSPSYIQVNGSSDSATNNVTLLDVPTPGVVVDLTDVPTVENEELVEFWEETEETGKAKSSKIKAGTLLVAKVVKRLTKLVISAVKHPIRTIALVLLAGPVFGMVTGFIFGSPVVVGVIITASLSFVITFFKRS